ncbi:MAG: hypothetical protein K0S15_1333 [Solirubrobacterales bacterium]|jgi:uncharacterized membrane protein YfcA|nr:hypothetical protein [Solirubrobacterales bacterium]
MTIGTSLFLIACGAILRYAVTAKVDWINVNTAGLVLMLIGLLGLALGIWFLLRGRSPDGAPPPSARVP